MPHIDRREVGIPAFDRFEEEYYRNRTLFRHMVQNLEERPYLCTDPLPYSRLLQNALRPVWTFDYRREARDYRVVSRGMLGPLEKIGARIVFHSPHEALTEANQIRLSWHTRGKAKQKWHYKAAYLPNMMHFDRLGYSGWSELCDLDAGRLADIPDSLADEFHGRAFAAYAGAGKSKHPQNEEEPVTATDYVFIPLQLPADSVIALKLFPDDYLRAMRTVIEVLAQSGARVIVKRHPLCTDPAVATLLAQLASGRVQISTASVHALLRKCRCVVTLNSGVGFEALMYLRPVVCLGKTDYAKACTELADPSGIAEAVEKAVATKNDALIRRLIFAAMNIHQFDPRDQVSVDRQILRALCHNYLETALR